MKVFAPFCFYDDVNKIVCFLRAIFFRARYHGEQTRFFYLPFLKSFALFDAFKPIKGEPLETYIAK